MPHKHFEKIKVEKLPESEALITGEITLPFLVELRKEAVESLSKSVKIPGFRTGHIPEDVLKKKLGEMSILEETAELALGREYSHIIEESKLSVIGRPEIAITKLAPGIPLEFKIKVHLEPEFELPDYKKIIKALPEEKENLEVEAEEVEKIMKELKDRNVNPELKEGEKLEEKIREELLADKEARAKEKRRIKIIESLVGGTKVALPKILIEEELGKMIGQFKHDIIQMGATWEKYLEGIKKTEKDIENEWREKAAERVKADLILSKIAMEEKLEPSAEELERETKHLLSHYPDADPMRARIYIYTHLRTQKVLEFLESIK